MIRRTVVGSLLVLLLLDFLSGGSAQAQRGGFACGNGVCERPFEDCSYCPRDCGVCPRCGDGRCTGDETCLRCPEDCGSCPLPEEEVVQLCGNGLCDTGEGCSSCAEDCGVCVSEDAGVIERWLTLLRNGSLRARRYARQLQRIAVQVYGKWEANAQQRRRGAEELLTFLGGEPDIAEHFTALDRKIVQFLSREGTANPLNIVPSLRVTYTLRRAARREARELSRLTSTILGYPTVQETLAKLPDLEELIAAAEGRDLEKAVELLPPPERSMDDLRKELDLLGQLFQDEPLEAREATTRWLVFRVFAQAAVQGSKEEFERAVQLLQQMREKAADPAATLPSLEERLEFLQARKAALAGIVNLPPEQVGTSLDEVQREADSSSSHTLIKLVGILRFIRASANFTTLEETFADASQRMRSGWRRFITLFRREETPAVEAEELLTETVEAADIGPLRGEEVEEQRAALRKIFSREVEHITPLLEELSSDLRAQHEAALHEWETKYFETAKTSMELRKALLIRSLLLKDIQDNARARRNVLFRIVYALQDFFGIRS